MLRRGEASVLADVMELSTKSVAPVTLNDVTAPCITGAELVVLGEGSGFTWAAGAEETKQG